MNVVRPYAKGVQRPPSDNRKPHAVRFQHSSVEVRRGRPMQTLTDVYKYSAVDRWVRGEAPCNDCESDPLSLGHRHVTTFRNSEML